MSNIEIVSSRNVTFFDHDKFQTVRTSNRPFEHLTDRELGYLYDGMYANMPDCCGIENFKRFREFSDQEYELYYSWHATWHDVLDERKLRREAKQQAKAA